MFGRLWPDRNVPGRPRLLLGSLGAGLLAAVVLPYRDTGTGTFLVLAAIAAVVAAADPKLRTRWHAAALTLCLLLGSVVFLRDAGWIVGLCVLSATGVAAVTLVPGRSFGAIVLSGIAVPLAAVRGLPWLSRSIVLSRSQVLSWALLRTLVIALVLVAVLVGLFASADALFAEWVSVVVPDAGLDSVMLRAFVLTAVTGLTSAFSYVALNPPRAESVSLATQPLQRTFEWLLPVGAVVLVFAVFVVAQLAVMFGGHDYLRRTTGVTYADHVHQGFAQMNVATVLTLVVVGVTARMASHVGARERMLLRVALGSLCSLTLVVVASAIYRMHVYQEAYGFTRLRLLVTVFECWLGLVLVLVLVAGVRLRGQWVPMTALVTGALALLALAWSNPDAYIASRNVERYVATGKADWDYLSQLSADAAAALAELPSDLLPCVSTGTRASDDDWLEWNLGRARATDVAAPGPRPCDDR